MWKISSYLTFSFNRHICCKKENLNNWRTKKNNPWNNWIQCFQFPSNVYCCWLFVWIWFISNVWLTMGCLDVWWRILRSVIILTFFYFGSFFFNNVCVTKTGRNTGYYVLLEACRDIFERADKPKKGFSSFSPFLAICLWLTSKNNQ